MGVSTNRVRTLIRDHRLLAVSRDGEPAVPCLFFDDLGIAKHFTGLVDVLLDGGFTRDEELRWLIPERADILTHPAAAQHTHWAGEVIRRAQAQAF